GGVTVARPRTANLGEEKDVAARAELRALWQGPSCRIPRRHDLLIRMYVLRRLRPGRISGTVPQLRWGTCPPADSASREAPPVSRVHRTDLATRWVRGTPAFRKEPRWRPGLTTSNPPTTSNTPSKAGTGCWS